MHRIFIEMDLKTIVRFRKNKLVRKAYLISMINIAPQKVEFSLDNFTSSECVLLFRFEKTDLLRLYRALNLSFTFKCRNGTICGGLEGLCILLRRLTYPNRLFDLSLLFGRGITELSLIINFVLDFIILNFGHLLTDLNQTWLTNNNLEVFAQAIGNKNAPLKNCWGFIDGTVRAMCRPNKFQRQCYNGHKRTHSLKYQSIVAANGLIANLFGPIEGRRHDAYLLAESKILEELTVKVNRNNEPFCLYGDPAYPIRPQLIGPFRGANISAEEQTFNRRMSMNRIVVEWGFGKIVQLFAFVDFKKNQKLFLQPLAKHFKVSTLLTNCHTCLYGSNTVNYFGVQPPELEEYLRVRI